jgi:hypothetical protein
MESDIHWNDPVFIYDWVIYLDKLSLITPADHRRLAGQVTTSTVVHNYAVSKAVEHSEHFVAYVTKCKLLRGIK